MLLYLARHGETEWNRLGKTQGIQDISLSELGFIQAQKLANRLKMDKKIDTIYCSDLSRAVATAKIIGDVLMLDPILNTDLREISFGDWEGLTIPEIETKFPGQLKRWRNDPSYSPEGGENLLSICNKVRSFMKQLLDTHYERDQNILIVSHSVTIKVLILNLIGIPLDLLTSFKLNQTGLSLISLGDGDNAVIYLNDSHHLNIDYGRIQL